MKNPFFQINTFVASHGKLDATIRKQRMTQYGKEQGSADPQPLLVILSFVGKGPAIKHL